MSTLANARALVMVLDGAESLGLPEPRYCTLMDTARQLHMQFADPDEVRAWATAYGAATETGGIAGGTVESTDVSLVIYDVPVYCYAHQQVPANA